MNLAVNLKKLREAKKLSQTAMAAKIGEGLSYYNKLEKEIMKPSVDVLIRLSKVYGITIDEIVYLNNIVLRKIVPAKVPLKRKYEKKAAAKKPAKKAGKKATKKKKR